MKRHGWLHLFSLSVIAFVAAHGIALYFASSHLGLSIVVVVGIIALVVLTHLGFWRRRHMGFRWCTEPGA